MHTDRTLVREIVKTLMNINEALKKCYGQNRSDRSGSYGPGAYGDPRQVARYSNTVNMYMHMYNCVHVLYAVHVCTCCFICSMYMYMYNAHIIHVVL